ncbi:MAG: hypothetical protein KAH67_01895 [Flavobacteriaceae bacterium]|nr:hypothetical protein [Flavobacteriaceae bacterium]
MKHLIILISICFSISLLGQETIDIFTVSGRYGFPQSYDSVYNGKAKEYGAMANLVVPIKFSEKTIWYNSVNYLYFHVTNDEDMPIDIANPINLHGIILRTGLYQKFSKDRAIQIFFSPRLMSDFNNIDNNHFQFGGMVMYEKKYSSKLEIGFGALYNQEFFGPYITPLINLNYQLSNRWSIVGLLPVYVKVKYKINDKLSTGISHFGLTSSYRLGELEYNGDYIERNSIDETLFARYHLTKNIHIEGRFGYAFERSYTQYEANQKVDLSIPLFDFGDDRTQKNISFHDGWIFNLRLVYNISIP